MAFIFQSTAVVDPKSGTSAEAFSKAEYLETYNQLLTKTEEASTQADEGKLEKAQKDLSNFQATKQQKFDVKNVGHVWLYLQR